MAYALLNRADAPADDGDVHEADDSDAVGHLHEALRVDDPVEKDYLIRQALQHIHCERDG